MKDGNDGSMVRMPNAKIIHIKHRSDISLSSYLLFVVSAILVIVVCRQKPCYGLNQE